MTLFLRQIELPDPPILGILGMILGLDQGSLSFLPLGDAATRRCLFLQPQNQFWETENWGSAVGVLWGGPGGAQHFCISVRHQPINKSEREADL